MKSIEENKKEFYLPPADFFDAVLEAKRCGFVTDRLGRMFMMLSDKIANHRFWIRYTHLRDDIISENLTACMKGFDYFEPYQRSTGKVWDGEEAEYSYKTCNNPHAWFTTCCMNNLRQFMKREYNQTNIVNKKRLESGLDASFGYEEMIKEQEDEAKEEHGEFDKPEPDKIKEMFGIDDE